MMQTATQVLNELRRNGELWEHAPGLIGLRGETLALFRAIGREVAVLTGTFTQDDWQVPPAVSFATLARADYFASFPQWLTAAGHLDPAALDSLACSDDPGGAAATALRGEPTALLPAVCYHVYERLAGAVLDDAHFCTVQGTCWRHEGDRCTPLERGWCFTMREAVCLGSASEVESFRAAGRAAAVRLAHRLGLDARTTLATDPFYAPSGRGRALLQRMKGLKHELLLPIGGGRVVAAASFNNHERFFGDAFGIRLADGTNAASGCIAFGLERWLLAVLVEHGTDARDWPLCIEADAREVVA